MGFLGIDIGGTFTDFLYADTSASDVRVLKVPSARGREWTAVATGIDELGVDLAQITCIVHGTTIATNTLLEGTGARTALVTTSGFRDTLEIGRCMRHVKGSLFDTQFRRPTPLIARRHRFECPERMRFDGVSLRVPSALELEDVAGQVALAQPEAVAICLLHAYANPAHERLVRDAIRRALPDVPVYLSSEILPEYREFERLTTTVINAVVSPALARYLGKLEQSLRRRKFDGPLLVMGSNGGVMTQGAASSLGAYTVLSGPVGGVRGAAQAALSIGRSRVITLDMGGTSTDIALVDEARVSPISESLIGGFPLRLPQLRINTVGAGGGSIAWCDEGGALQVGPTSAGADPGPACYGSGGEHLTVTDANLLLGRLEEGMLLGGHIRLVLDPAVRAAESLSAALGLPVERLAEGVIKIAVARMSRAIREVCLDQGADPRDFPLVAFGGAGPMHAALVAQEIGVQEVIIPLHPGNVSAYGLLASDLRREISRTMIREWDAISPPELLGGLRRLGEHLETQVRTEHWPAQRCEISYAVDLRCVGQAFEVAVPLEGLSGDAVGAVPDAFHRRHFELYGQSDPDAALELVTLRASISAPAPARVELRPAALQGARNAADVRRVWFEGRPRPTHIVPRQTLASGRTVEGPGIIVESGATTVVPPGWTFDIRTHGVLVLTRR